MLFGTKYLVMWVFRFSLKPPELLADSSRPPIKHVSYSQLKKKSVLFQTYRDNQCDGARYHQLANYCWHKPSPTSRSCWRTETLCWPRLPHSSRLVQPPASVLFCCATQIFFFYLCLLPHEITLRDQVWVQLQSAEPWSQSAAAVPCLLNRVAFAVYSECIHVEGVFPNCPRTTHHTLLGPQVLAFCPASSLYAEWSYQSPGFSFILTSHLNLSNTNSLMKNFTFLLISQGIMCGS